MNLFLYYSQLIFIWYLAIGIWCFARSAVFFPFFPHSLPLVDKGNRGVNANTPRQRDFAVKDCVILFNKQYLPVFGDKNELYA
jgi:hypothetical protein